MFSDDLSCCREDELFLLLVGEDSCDNYSSCKGVEQCTSIYQTLIPFRTMFTCQDDIHKVFSPLM